MINPATVVKKDGKYFLYYLGAAGDRRPPHKDRGPRHRALGVATSNDGIHFTKYSGNPIITFLPNNNDEEGIFSAGGTLDANGNVVLYYGGMDAGSAVSTSVDGDIRLAISENGLDFTDLGDVVSHADISVWGYGDELFPVGAFQANGTWYVYYISKSTVAATRWDLGIAWGPNRDNLPNSKAVLTSGNHIIGGGDPVKLGPDHISLFIVRDLDSKSSTIFLEHVAVEVRTAPKKSPGTLCSPVELYDFPEVTHATTFFDKETNTWFMYYLNNAGNAIRVKTASVREVKPVPKPSRN